MTVEVKFCPRCGAPLPGQPPTRCARCAYELFVNPRPTGTVILLRPALTGPEFLALKRAREPRRGHWDLPGGFCDGWEHPADAAVREAREELGVDVRLGSFVGMYVDSYEFQGEVLPVLNHFWLASVVGGAIAVDAAEASGHAWFALAEPPALAFSTMDRAISDVVGLVGERSGH